MVSHQIYLVKEKEKTIKYNIIKLIVKIHDRVTFNQLLCLLNVPPSNSAMMVQDFCSPSTPVGFAANILATLVTLPIKHFHSVISPFQGNSPRHIASKIINMLL